jgi:hypothetical protein
VIGIFTSRAMRERGRYQIQLMKTRSSSGVGSKIDLEFDIDSLRIRDLDDEDESYSSAPMGGSNIMNSLKRTTITNDTNEAPEPDDGSPVKKVRADTDSTKLREFLGNLGNE